jgi:Flp pilus assembly protein TadG
MSMEMVILTPIFIGFLLLLAGFGRLVDVQSQIDGAARDAARAASIARSRDGTGGAQELAQKAADASLAGNNWCLGGPNVTTDITAWGPGGQVTVQVDCEVKLGDVAWVGFPGTSLKHGTATAPIDKYTYRGGGNG